MARSVGGGAREDSRFDADVGAEPGEVGGEVFVQLLVGHRGKRIQDEQGTCGAVAQPRAAALTPVPPPAGDAGVIALDDLTGVGVLGDVGAAGTGIESVVASGTDEAGCADVTVKVLAAERHLMQDGDRVIEVRQPVHPWQSVPGPAKERLEAVPRALRFRTEATVGIPPRRNVWHLLDRCCCQEVPGCCLRLVEQSVTGVVAFPQGEAGHGEEAGAVVRSKREDLIVDAGPAEEVVLGRHGVPAVRWSGGRGVGWTYRRRARRRQA